MKNTLSSFARSKALILALGVVFALPAMARAEGFKGKFTLETETRWGMAVLHPGNYNFVVDSTSAPAKVVVRDDEGKVAAILISMWSSGITPGETNKIQLETRGSSTFVSAVYLKDVDTELHFAVPNVLVHEAKAPFTTMTASAQ